MKITWLGHACFEIQHKGYSIILDPYKPGKVPGLKSLKVRAHKVLCSHDHDDHNYEPAVEIIKDNLEEPFKIEVIDTWHDEVQGAKRGKNKIHILSADGIRVAHMGDLGCFLTKEQVVQLGSLDAIMIPIGGVYTLDATEAKTELDKLDVKVILPMHYRSENFGFDEIGDLSMFTRQYDNSLVKEYHHSSIEIQKGEGQEIAVLQPKQLI